MKYCSGGPGAKPARGLLSHLSLGLRPDSQRPGRRIGPPRRPPPPPAWAACRPRRRDALAAVDQDRTVVRGFRQNKTRVAVVEPQTLASFSPPPSLSTLRSGDGHWPWWPGGAGGTASSRLARRRARSPEREHPAVEPAVDGATLSSPAHATPASRSSEQVAPLCREVRRAVA